jgi:hypothetical protein
MRCIAFDSKCNLLCIFLHLIFETIYLIDLWKKLLMTTLTQKEVGKIDIRKHTNDIQSITKEV